MTPPEPAWGSGPYSIKRHGVTLETCDSEPVQTPGCVQGHGVLLVLAPQDLRILQVSENSAALLGVAPAALLGQPAAAALGEGPAAELAAFLASESVAARPLHALTLAAAGRPALELTVHSNDGVVLAELEPVVPTGAAPDYYALVTRTVARLQGAASLDELCLAVTEEVRALTGYDRVMVYRFHSDGHGEVIGESRRPDLPSWIGLHYPAEDIPAPARAVFQQLWLRPIFDVDGPLAELVPLARPDTGGPLLMTHCVLRGASQMYIRYLRNMGVTAGLTLSLRQGTSLWGLISCHHYSGPHQVPFAQRAACEFLAQVTSRQVHASDERERLQRELHIAALHRQLVGHAAAAGDLAALFSPPGPGETSALCTSLGASGAALQHQGQVYTIGATPTPAEIDALAAWLGEHHALNDRAAPEGPRGPVYVTNALAQDFPPAAAYSAVASGLLAVPLARGGRSLLLWFRPETPATITWAGDPHGIVTSRAPCDPYLTPRQSFARFLEAVRGRSRPWLPVEVDAACRLRVQLLELVVDRAERLAELNAALQQSEDRLRQGDRRKDEFLATLAHELRNPLAPLSTGLSILRIAPAGSPSGQRAQELMQRSLAHLVHLVDDLLDVSRISQGKIALRLERLSLRAVVDAALESTGAAFAEKRHRLTVCLPDEPLEVSGDPTRLTQVVVNLLTNAAKYTDPGGQVCLTLRREGAGPAARAVIEVRDSGVGIAPALLPTIWNLFTQVRDTLDKAQGGLGIGLSIVRRLVEMHGGSVAAASEGPGRGSTFTVRLPVLDAPAAVSVTSAATAQDEVSAPSALVGDAAPGVLPRRVLVVDDSADVAESMVILLEADGHEVRVARDGPQALALAREFRPEVVLLDVGLPGMDGYEVARRLRQDPAALPPGAVLCAVTGWGSADDKRRAREAGFDHHLTKPIDLAALERILQTPR